MPQSFRLSSSARICFPACWRTRPSPLQKGSRLKIFAKRVSSYIASKRFKRGPQKYSESKAGGTIEMALPSLLSAPCWGTYNIHETKGEEKVWAHKTDSVWNLSLQGLREDHRFALWLEFNLPEMLQNHMVAIWFNVLLFLKRLTHLCCYGWFIFSLLSAKDAFTFSQS